MGGSGSGGQTTQQGPPPYATPTAQGILSLVQQTLAQQGQSMPPGMNYNVAPFTPFQNQGISGIGAQTPAAQQLGSQGAGMLGNTLSGAYLNPATNPYLSATANEAGANLVNQYQTATAPGDAAFAEGASGGGPGSTTGSGSQQMVALDKYGLGQNIANLDTNIYGGNYQAERSNQINALGQLGATQSSLYAPSQELFNAGQLQQQQQQNVSNTSTQNATNQNAYPWQQLQRAGGIFGSLFGPSAQLTTSGGGGK